MKITFLAAVLLLSSTFAKADAYRGWIVGKNYLAQWSEAEMGSVPTQRNVSHAFDPKGCRLWLMSSDGTLSSYLNSDLSPVKTLKVSAGAIVSYLSDGHFFVLTQNGELQKRTAEGQVATTFSIADADKLLRLESSADAVWGLFLDSTANRIWLRRFDPQLNLKKEIPVASANVIWANPRLHVHSGTDEAWVGYSTSAVGLSTTPMVKRFLPDGSEASVFSWGQRGLFFDQCEEGDHMLAARDLPTPPYTVPVFSFIDELVPGAKPKRQYAAPDNYFIDSLSCRADSFWMVQRSIFGSDGSYLVGFDRRVAKETKRVKLEGPAEQLYGCE